MLNPKVKLNTKVFDADVELKPTRDGYGDGLVIAGTEDANVVVLCADLTESTRSHKFQEKFPERFFEMGVAEQNMATVAAGLGISGKVAFISSYATFSPGRNWEQIRTTVAYNDSNVKIAGHHAGLMTGPDGATHQAIEDIATMRSIANMRVIVPCDSIQARQATVAAAKIKGPVYLRFAREKTPIITTDETPFEIGKNVLLWKSKNPTVTIFVAGVLTHGALVAAKELTDENIETAVVNVHSIKPLDEKNIVEMAKKTGAVVTVEEHQVNGGLGGAIAELLAKKQPTPMEMVGMQDIFGESGPPKELVEKYNLGPKGIKEAVKQALKRVA
ncbi:MAG: transketolase C-terminal domain-containing protein [bacterium]|nr:transketolase C-terminal domain-containing protein [bacterium]